MSKKSLEATGKLESTPHTPPYLAGGVSVVCPVARHKVLHRVHRQRDRDEVAEGFLDTNT